MTSRKKHTIPPIGGVIYPSIAEAAQQLGIPYTRLSCRVVRSRKTGRSVQTDVLIPRGHGGYIDGVYYPSIKAARRALRLQFEDVKALMTAEKERRQSMANKNNRKQISDDG